MAQQQAAAEAFMRLVGIMDELREKCPWDKKQTVQTLRPEHPVPVQRLLYFGKAKINQ